MVESTKLSSKYTPQYLKSMLNEYDGSRKIVFVLINESDEELTLMD
jgi:hypothetical protein